MRGLPPRVPSRSPGRPTEAGKERGHPSVATAAAAAAAIPPDGKLLKAKVGIHIPRWPEVLIRRGTVVDERIRRRHVHLPFRPSCRRRCGRREHGHGGRDVRRQEPDGRAGVLRGVLAVAGRRVGLGSSPVGPAAVSLVPCPVSVAVGVGVGVGVEVPVVTVVTVMVASSRQKYMRARMMQPATSNPTIQPAVRDLSWSRRASWCKTDAATASALSALTTLLSGIGAMFA
ncbi:hypothetical protein CTA1_4334 [Colletotrichum tanaceti]|uniref:Uncharacterized protein n=1 Tax=Colletotrichum tanaceti TaxID=1306861 RepID=A0A4U6XE78_9PEZI|nr:hypothetical protein CTA1_4334 [Colletotrichum tanaceti]